MQPYQQDELAHIVTVGIALSHVYHLLSVLALYSYGKLLLGPRNAIPFLAAALHVLSPAGVFLSAPYAEPLFSLLTFLGYYLYTQSVVRYSDGHKTRGNVFAVAAGLVLGLSVTVRSNGLLNGMLFLYEVLILLGKPRYGLRSDTALRLLSLVIGGSSIAAGAVFPQYIAYTIFCRTEGEPRAWCMKWVPSIYGWVQSHYW